MSSIRIAVGRPHRRSYMKAFTCLALAAMTTSPIFAAPTPVGAQPYATYGSYDPCREARREAGTNGAVAGGALGAVLGSAIAGRGSRFGGAVVGGTVGAVAGHEIGRSSVRCVAYPHRYQART